MKKYKLLQDINWADAGTIFNQTEHNESFWVRWIELVEWESLWSILDLMKCIGLNNKEWFEEIEEVKSIYDLKDWDVAFNLLWDDIVLDFNEEDHKIAIEAGEVFLTKEQAETELQKRKAMATIKKWSHDNDWGYEWIRWEDNCSIYFSGNAEELDYIRESRDKSASMIYYSSVIVVKKAMVELEVEYKILFNIK